MLDKEQILDLIHHVISDRANVAEIDTLIDWLQERKEILANQALDRAWERFGDATTPTFHVRAGDRSEP